jgi:SAM-dependent methyltransferase
MPACPLCHGTAIVPATPVGEYRFRACRDCRLVYTPDAGAVEDRYQETYRGFREDDHSADEGGWASTEFLDPVWPLLPDRPLRILDFGAGESRIPDLLRHQGHRVLAVDLAPPQQPHPDRLTGTLSELDLPVPRFDLVYAFQVFEHLPQPRAALDELVHLLDDGGVLAVHTDMETPEREDFATWWYVRPPDHCTFYRNDSFRRYAAQRGLEVLLAEEKLVGLARRGNEAR